MEFDEEQMEDEYWRQVEEDKELARCQEDSAYDAMVDAQMEAQYEQECKDICIACCKEHGWPDCPKQPKDQTGCIVEKITLRCNLG